MQNNIQCRRTAGKGSNPLKYKAFKDAIFASFEQKTEQKPEKWPKTKKWARPRCTRKACNLNGYRLLYTIRDSNPRHPD